MEKFAAQHAYFFLHFFSSLFSSPLPEDFFCFTSIINVIYYRQTAFLATITQDTNVKQQDKVV